MSGLYEYSARLGRVVSGLSDPKHGSDVRRISRSSTDLKPRGTLSPMTLKRLSGSYDTSAQLGRVRLGASEP